MKLNNTDRRLPEVDWKQKAYNVCEFYANAFRLNQSRAICARYSTPHANRTIDETIRGMMDQSIAEHSFSLEWLMFVVYTEFRDLFKQRNIPPEVFFAKGAFHDFAEAITGDSATDVDGVTREMKDIAETGSIKQVFSKLSCYDYVLAEFKRYESKEDYESKIIKMGDSLELVLFALLLVSNGFGRIAKDGDTFVIDCNGKSLLIDKRAYGEISDYFKKCDGDKWRLVDLSGSDLDELTVAQIMYDHSLVKLQQRFGDDCPELIDIFLLICGVANEFRFVDYNLENKPAMFAK